MSGPVWRMVSMQMSSARRRRHALHCKRGGSDSLDGAGGVPFDAGDPHQAPDGIASHVEVVLEGDLGGVLNLRRGAAHGGAKAGGGHRGSRAYLGLAADLGARDRGVVLDDAANGGASEEIIAHALLRRADLKLQIVA